MKTIKINAMDTMESYEAMTKEMIAWLSNPENWDDPIYSDIHKEVYGVRPRW